LEAACHVSLHTYDYVFAVVVAAALNGGLKQQKIVTFRSGPQLTFSILRFATHRKQKQS